MPRLIRHGDLPPPYVQAERLQQRHERRWTAEVEAFGLAGRTRAASTSVGRESGPSDVGLQCIADHLGWALPLAFGTCSQPGVQLGGEPDPDLRRGRGVAGQRRPASPGDLLALLGGLGLGDPRAILATYDLLVQVNVATVDVLDLSS